MSRKWTQASPHRSQAPAAVLRTRKCTWPPAPESPTPLGGDSWVAWPSAARGERTFGARPPHTLANASSAQQFKAVRDAPVGQRGAIWHDSSAGEARGFTENKSHIMQLNFVGARRTQVNLQRAEGAAPSHAGPIPPGFEVLRRRRPSGVAEKGVRPPVGKTFFSMGRATSHADASSGTSGHAVGARTPMSRKSPRIVLSRRGAKQQGAGNTCRSRRDHRRGLRPQGDATARQRLDAQTARGGAQKSLRSLPRYAPPSSEPGVTRLGKEAVEKRRSRRSA